MVAVADRPGARQVCSEVLTGRQARWRALRVGRLAGRPPAAACHRAAAPSRGAACAQPPASLPASPCSRFLWVSSGEPHAIRRRELLSKYGEQIRKLYGYDHATAYQVGAKNGLLFLMRCYADG